ncbi:uncharacterized protein MONOS_3529 [Monocercomonoides exilis]|uniref:uncharacterized protein n=1 Tax=Monocercomonoides exilis TaxID=2049356 RepID=UPI00355A92BB|nr:hypothetical protein MONOS_3529 [Monocercomonoides exilis]|eukprot:MONOS_3529.1-p1 / transcript=MONOS_3529.1 / gene=MONOS_3529 / organism=Monocercomonoides_exilis_PA203 / gene_product=unspecified product / transcript_product=unspecified product / location=Mono_scaffold00083:113272-121251(+) / protein_length=2659 / sequence_SO=supercontig / SO=protein_coding / is_pseudo=false
MGDLAIISCSFWNCSCTSKWEGGAIFCRYLLNNSITKTNFTNCSAGCGGATCADACLHNANCIFSENKVERCSITSTVGTGWYFSHGKFVENFQFLFSKCKCITNTGSDSTGSLTFNYPPEAKPAQFSVTDCQFMNNELTASVKYGGAAIYFTYTFNWMNGFKLISFCFFDGNTATNGRGNDVFFNGNDITQSPFENCGSTTPTNRVWNNGTADNVEFNSWLPLIAQNKIVASNGTDADACGRPQHTPCATIEYALTGFISLLQDASLTLLSSTFVPTQTLTFSAVNTIITGNGTIATAIASSGIPQPQNSYPQSSQSRSSFSSFSLSSSSTSSSPDPSASSALFQQTQGSLTVSALAIAHNSTNSITPILFHLSNDSPSLNLNTTTITGTTPSSSSITTPLFFIAAGSLALNHTSITQLALNSQSIFHLTSLTAPLTLNSSNITDITSTATPTSCVLSSATSPALSLSIANCTITNINSEQFSQQTATNGGCISFASSVSDNTFSASDTTFSTCSVSEDTSSGGRGGALMIEYKDDSQVSSTTLSITNIVFSANKASIGRDMYFVCESLVDCVNESSFAFMRSIDQKDNSIVGHDRTEAFGDWNVNLFIFFDGYFADSVYVDGASGVEKVYCGLEKAPCKSVNYGIEHLKRTQNTKEEIILSSNSLMTGCLDVGGMCMKAKTETIVEIECQSDISGSEGECVLKSTSLTEMEFIGIVVPSSFSRTISTVIESSTQNGELHMKNCAMSVIGGKQNTIGFFLIKSTGKMVELDTVRISDVKSTVSLFSLSLSSANMNDHEYKVKLLNCTLQRLEIDSTTTVDGKAAVFGESVGVGLVMNGSTIEGAVSEKSKEGGALKIVLSEGGYVALENSSLTGCICENMSEGGKGGGIYLNCSSHEGEFQLSSIKFSGCSATVGKNMFVKCGNLVNSVNTERFAFDCSGYKDDGNAFVGEDGIYGEMDLRIFLVSLKWVIVSVSTDGHDTLGCGSEVFPCQSMKSGIDHIDRNGTEGERKVKVRDEGTIEDIYSFSDALVIDGCVNEGDEIKHRPIHFEGTIKGNSESSSVISSTSSLILLSLKLQIPSQFISNMNKLISSSGVLQLKNCSFEIQSSMDIIQYSLITTTTGSCTLKECSFADCSFAKSPLMISSSVLFENNNFSNITNTGSGEGGLARVTLKNDEDLVIKSTNASSCSLSEINGKGGFLYLDCQNCLNEKPFLFDIGITFENNNATIGKNVFILGKDLNSSVTNDSFKFDYSSMTNDGNLFVGSDDFHDEKDLFMFLIPYSSFEIFISSEGYDAARCGSEEEPCFTMWKGMENMEKGIGNKTIQIEGSTFIRDSYDLSNYQIKKASFMGEENTKAILNFEKSIGSQLEYFMENDDHLELTNIQLQLSSGFDNSAKTIISNKGGDLAIRKCSFHSEAGMNNGFDCVFVDAIGGSVEVNDLSIESCNVGNSIFVINNAGITCHFLNVRMESLNESRGCLLLIKGPELTTKINEGGEEMSLNIDNSSISGVKRSDNGASILESKSEKKIDLAVKESYITGDKAEESEKGGAVFFTLGASGSMKMIDSTISHCSSSINSGKGGGVYLATKETGVLNFTFVGMKFSANTAKVGNDIFIECFNISSQINEIQFRFDLRENHYSRINAIYGRDESDYPIDTDLIEFVTIHQSDTIIVSSVNGSNEKQCGTNTLPCYSIDHGLMHLTSDFMSVMIIVEESEIGGEIELNEMRVSSKSRVICKVEVKSEIESTREALVTTAGTVSLVRVSFVFDSDFISSHESLISPEGGILEIMNCSFTTKQSNEEGNPAFASIPFHIINMEKGELQLDGCTMSNLILHESALYLSSQLLSVIYLLSICNLTISHSLIEIIECGQLNVDRLFVENITVEGNDELLISCLSMKKTMQLTNCTLNNTNSKTTKGKLMKLENCSDVKMDICVFDGSSKERNKRYLNKEEEEICRWHGSLVDEANSSVMMKDTTISNSAGGGITMSGGNVIIEKGEFLNNNPSIDGYPSLRRNVICSDSGTLNVMSLKGGDGWKDNASLWMLNDGCSFEGIASERDSSFFIPVLESVEAKKETDRLKLKFKGLLLIPCNLSFSVVKRKGEEKEIEKHEFDENGFLSEREIEGSMGKDLISNCGNEIEVSACILFGNSNSPSSTNSFILRNRTEPEPKGDERIAEGNKKGKFSWALVVILIFAVLFVIALIGFIIFVVRWRKQKRRTKELEIIVEDTVKKDPKLIEMMTMEMSPEEQWRRAEREAEKKNEENAKRRMCGKKMAHSESEEYLLSESGSTEYILGKDSDKIPEWALEKVEEKEIEEEETRKRSPSPSISSTSTTDTSDTDTTFVRSESLCPTTSSMSNLVDAMACSCPYEKLIVDLRDSLFMLLHGRNEKKEMAIGTLQQREQTAAQILLWTVNGALHSFDEMENTLSSLVNLSPHIVLFSEHMVICIALHSDFSSDDSDSSSISSATIVSSSSSISVVGERFTGSPPPSSAFEDDEDNKLESLRWKAPELQMNKKMGATKESVVFSIGMMLWECLTLEVPFREFEADVAGQKIVTGERPSLCVIGTSIFHDVVKGCFSAQDTSRPSLNALKRELAQRISEAFTLTVSDAIILNESLEKEDENRENLSKSFYFIQTINEKARIDKDELQISSKCQNVLLNTQ